MLPVYGELMPLRLLEELVFWKTQEMEHTLVIRQLVPDLEPAYAALLQNWETAFSRTLETAQSALRAAVAVPGAPLPPEWTAQLPGLVRHSVLQSAEFIRQLMKLQELSAAVRRRPTVPIVLAHIRRESEYFVGVIEELGRTGALPWMRPDAGPAQPSAPAAMPAPVPARAAAEQPAGDGPDPAAAEPASGDSGPAAPLRPDGTWSDPAAAAADAPGRPVPIGGHVLPPLPYPYNALEPFIDEKTMRIHHDKHHQSYVDGLNKAEKKLEEARRTGDFELVKHWERELAFNGAGHYLHTIFWEIMTPRSVGRPGGVLADQIRRDFGGFEPFKKQFTEAAAKVEGGGWAILVWSPRSHRLEILTAEKHQNLSQWDTVPLLPLDVWEHAYYLKHQNDRAAYINDWWHVVNWPAVADRFAKARTLKWKPY
jgi:Fe-Mn family superoxide dismutase